jgi:hypothetical protein
LKAPIYPERVSYSFSTKTVKSRLEETVLKADSPNHVKTLQPHSGRGVNLEIVYRSLLRIASHLAISQSSKGVAHEDYSFELAVLIKGLSKFQSAWKE